MSRLARIWKITYTFSLYRLDDLMPQAHLPLPVRMVLKMLPWRWWQKRLPKSRGARLRLALESLGPIFVKFGQILSTRPDLIPEDIIDELRQLQDNVPPFSSDQAIELIEQQLGNPIDDVFAQFDPKPMASASIAQVHAATLHAKDVTTFGDQVVVKVVRPGIEKTIEKDLRLLEMMARLFEKYSADGQRLHPVDVVEDYRHTIFGELNLQTEASNASQIRKNFENTHTLHVPAVVWDLTRTKVMVSERIYGVPVSDIEQLRAQGTNFPLLAERGVEIFFTQVFRDSFFHADMHPGNIFVSHDNPNDPQYISIDCGIVGSLTDQDQHYLAMNLLAFFNQDYTQVAQLHIDSGWVPSDTKLHELSAAIRSVCDPMFDKPLSEISFGQVLIQLFITARRFHMEVQPQLVLLQKTLLNIEGLGRQLYPELNLWNTAKPFLEKWLRDRYGPKAAIKELRRQLPRWLEKAPQIPDLMHNSLARLSHLDEQQQALQAEITLVRAELAKQREQRWWIFSAAIIGAALYFAFSH